MALKVSQFKIIKLRTMITNAEKNGDNGQINQIKELLKLENFKKT